MNRKGVEHVRSHFFLCIGESVSILSIIVHETVSPCSFCYFISIVHDDVVLSDWF